MGDGGKVVNKTDTDSTGSDTDTDSEQVSTDRSPVSGSVHYFIAPLDSSKAQAMVIEELNQVRLFKYKKMLHTMLNLLMWNLNIILSNGS